MNISNVVSILSSALNLVRKVLQPIPGLLLICTCTRRPGLSSIATAAKVFADMDYVEPGVNDDIVKEFVFNVVDQIKRNIQDDGVCFIVIPPGELRLQLTGGNAGGPVVSIGTNTNFVFLLGIIR